MTTFSIKVLCIFLLIFCSFEALAKKTSLDPNQWPSSFLFSQAKKRAILVEEKLHPKGEWIYPVADGLYAQNDFGDSDYELMYSDFNSRLGQEEKLVGEHRFENGKKIYTQLVAEERIVDTDSIQAPLETRLVLGILSDMENTKSAIVPLGMKTVNSFLISSYGYEWLVKEVIGDGYPGMENIATFKKSREMYLVLNLFTRDRIRVSRAFPYQNYIYELPVGKKGITRGYAFDVDQLKWRQISEIYWRVESKKIVPDPIENIVKETRLSVASSENERNWIAAEDFEIPENASIDKISNSMLIAAANLRADAYQIKGFESKIAKSYSSAFSCMKNRELDTRVLNYHTKISINGQSIELLFKSLTGYDFAAEEVNKKEKPRLELLAKIQYSDGSQSFEYLPVYCTNAGYFIGLNDHHQMDSPQFFYKVLDNLIYTFFQPIKSDGSADIFKWNFDKEKGEPQGEVVHWSKLSEADAMGWWQDWQKARKAAL